MHDLSTGRNLLGVSFIRSLKSNLWTTVTKQGNTENNFSHTHKTRLHFSLFFFFFFFLMEYVGYWSKTRDSRLSRAQTNAKVNCIRLSHYLYFIDVLDYLTFEV
jgi:hypothetical protein